ncbi:hypothetical protein PPERSA_02458 [Pseudocohnilembus persalinus]|uniref:Methyltransferase domain-containing protein n=1 Tax=Pseudocohnilembus persalinus TaxID=266149 RepID=A0A0V0QAY0_PSEPJ|nr:hypothetical protein PPERSA_02458 [Pseudocohnilembus persalinus]|eukprot:KRW99346.1 hypothetical protein PPERSA_02458 [Pseudocohnilembus persalinus]
MELIKKIQKLLFFIPVFIYDLVISRMLTIVTYKIMMKELKKDEKQFNQIKDFLDIGVGTARPLYEIYPDLPKNTQVLGVDIDANYVKAAQQLFKKNDNVEIKLEDFYNIEKNLDGRKFDIVLFSSSFMLMPDKQWALNIAKQLLKPNGKILFILTLNEKKNPIAEKIKPIIKYITTIDFGAVTYKKDFMELMQKQNDLNMGPLVRIYQKSNPLTYLLKIYYVEAVRK